MSIESPLRVLALAALLCVARPLSAADPAEAPPETEVMQDEHGDRVSILGGEVHVPRDVRLHGDVVSVGGDVHVDGEVLGDVVVVLGKLEVRGRVEGSVVGVATEQVLDGAEVDDAVVGVLGSTVLRRSHLGNELVVILNRLDKDAATIAEMPVQIGSWFPGFWRVLFLLRLIKHVGVFVLVLLICALAPERVRRIGEEVRERYAAAFFVGLLGYLGVFVVLSLLLLTVIALPMGLLAFWVFKWLGIAGIFFAVGRGLGRLAGRELSLLGAVLVAFALYTVLSFSPSGLGFVGLVVLGVLRVMFFVAVEVPALGLVLLTRAGNPPPSLLPRTVPLPTPVPGPL